MTIAQRNSTIEFDVFTLSLRPLALTANGEPIELRNQSLKLLALLADRAGDLVTHDQIRTHLWGEQHVDFARGIQVCIGEIRQVLKEHGASETYIETLPRQGYRFVADIRRSPHRINAGNVKGSRRRPVLVTAALGVAVAIGAAILMNMFGSPTSTESELGTARARDAYLKGQYLLQKGDADSLKKGEAYFAEAIGFDARFVPAYEGLAETAFARHDPQAAREQAAKAIAIDPQSARSLLVLAKIALWSDWDWTAAARRIERVTEADPQNAHAYMLQAWLMLALGRRDEALQTANHALSLDPVSTLLPADYGWLHYYSDDLATAHQYCGQAMELDPDNAWVTYCRHVSALALGDLTSAADAAARIVEMYSPQSPMIRRLRDEPSRETIRDFQIVFRDAVKELVMNGESAVHTLAIAEAHLGNHDAALEALQRALDDRPAMLPIIVRDRVFEPIYSDPRYLEIVNTLDIPPRATM